MMSTHVDTQRKKTAATVPESALAGPGTGQVAFDLVLTILLVGLVLFGAMKLWPRPSGATPQPLAAILFGTLLPIASMLIVSLLERLFAPAGPRKSLHQCLLILQVGVFWFFIQGFTYAFVAMGASAAARSLGWNLGLIDLRFVQGRGIIAIIGAVYLYAIVRDFFFYWYHRLAHRVPILWQLHKFHHMDPALDAFTTSRDNWLDAVYAALTFSLPMVLLVKFDGLSPWQIGFLGGSVAAVTHLFLSLGHMNVRFQVGKVANLFYCSPQMHRIHHSCLPQHFDKNFAFAFPLWDVIFGTYYGPAKDEFPPTGVPGETEVRTFWEAEAFTIRQWWKMFQDWQRRTTARSVPST